MEIIHFGYVIIKENDEKIDKRNKKGGNRRKKQNVLKKEGDIYIFLNQRERKY